MSVSSRTLSASRMPARTVCSIWCRVRLSTFTASMPARWSRCDSIRPAGPAPTIPTLVRVTPRSVMGDPVARSSSARASRAIAKAWFAAGTPQYTAVCSSTSAISSSDRPLRRAATTCRASSSQCPWATNAVMVMTLRVRRSSPGRVHTEPHAVSVMNRWKSAVNGVTRSEASST